MSTCGNCGKSVQPKKIENRSIVPTQTAAQQVGAEVRQLRACINDLIGVVALAAIWKGAGRSEIVYTLLDMLLSVVHLDFVYLRVNAPVGEPPMEIVRAAHPQSTKDLSSEIRELLQGWPERRPQKLPLVVQNPFGAGELSIVPLPLGLAGEIGVLVAGCRRTGFPAQTETLLLNVA